LALRGLIGFILLILVVTGIRNGDDGVQTHAALWTACAWGATLAARKITPRLKRAFLD
jgi:hypothetical protein